ncbi:MAG: Stk1 family PASTA domain-containing Ser/Thr kinase, partial [Propionibacteriaceae bacterium]|nr:Stk1 family PASTA domain-containing Ser/Thr kinase [Propionibacteriaceae bacterium]
GMAEVRRARDLRLGRDVAVKQLRVDLATDSTFQARFRREAQSAAGLNHPNIVAVYDTGEEADPATGVQVPYIVMELVDGHTLREILRTGRQIQPEKALEFAQGVLDALSYSHKAGIVHRDIKPANVMLTPSGQIKVMDFGIARAVADTSATMTQTAAVIGTAQYLSPEQARGETVDSRSDIYSAGCLLYELLVGRPPFQGDSPVSVAYQHVREAPVPPSQLDPMISPGMDAIVLKALAKDPADRYQTAAAMRADIGRLLAGQDVIARPPRPTTPLPGASDPTVLVASPTSVLSSDTGTQNGTATRALEPVPRRNLTPLWISLGTIAVILAGIGIFLLLNPLDQPKKVEVPSLVNMTAARATEELERLELVPDLKRESGPDDATKGLVIFQDTPAGTPVEIGTVIRFTVNVGPLTKAIPTGLRGQPYQDVVNQLTELGFTAVNADVDPSEPITAVADEVTDVNPAEGAEVPLDTPIKVLYATGESVVPNFTGMTEDQALAEADRSGFRDVRTSSEPSDATPGTVISQKPGRGEVVSRTTRIQLVFAEAKPSEGIVPNFRTLSRQSAIDEAKRVGFLNVTFTTEPSDAVEGQVISQTPGVGQKVPLTTEIKLVLAGPMSSPPPDESEDGG